MKQTIASICFAAVGLTFASPIDLYAQDAIEYKMEIGGSLGAAFGLTDLNSKIFGHPNLGGGAMARFVINPRMAVKTMLSYSSLNGKTSTVKEFYPSASNVAAEKLNYNFKGGVYDLGATYELNFLPYGYLKGYQGLSRIAPYIQAGFGLCYSSAKAFSIDLPIGVGVKYKIKPRLNMGLDWQFHFSLSDKLDGLKESTGVSSSGFKNKDHFSNLLITISYDIMPKCPNCNRD